MRKNIFTLTKQNLMINKKYVENIKKEKLERITMNLNNQIQNEIARCRKLFTFCNRTPAVYYREVIISREIALAKKAIADNDIVGMAQSLLNLKTF